MKHKRHILLTGLLILVMISSCTVHKVNIPAAPLHSQMNFEMDDLEYVKEIDGNAVQSYFLGIPYGQETKYKMASTSSVYGQIVNLNNAGINNALYKALEEDDDIDFVIPVSLQVESHRMFMGRVDSVSIRLKAFKFNLED